MTARRLSVSLRSVFLHQTFTCSKRHVMDEEKFRRFIYTNLTKGPSIAAEAGEGSASSERGEKKGKKEEKGGKKSLTIATEEEARKLTSSKAMKSWRVAFTDPS